MTLLVITGKDGEYHVERATIWRWNRLAPRKSHVSIKYSSMDAYLLYPEGKQTGWSIREGILK
ncbi:hypothetical protein I7I48_06306 [Histoplasma ohiense]|nr:hypothetical protein I7I48_06306 [Histoplasma ohiense (nom. inval.)]